MPTDINGGTHDSIVPLASKAEGAFVALAAGDALGWPQEIRGNIRSNFEFGSASLDFKRWDRRSGGRFGQYKESISPGAYSDDTQLTLAVARSRTHYGSAWWKALTKVELPLWIQYERGGGGATKRAAGSWARGKPPWKASNSGFVRGYFEAGGNGVAMRALPHALFLERKDSPSELIHDVVLDGSATHGHPRALIGACAYAFAAWTLARQSSTLRMGELIDVLIDEKNVWGEIPNLERGSNDWFKAADNALQGGYEDVWNRTVSEMQGLLEEAKKGVDSGALVNDRKVFKALGCFGQTKGAGTCTTAASVYLVSRYAVQPEQGILRAAYEYGTDTDTIAAMTGGLMGCLSGKDWLPSQWSGVQDAKYVRELASRIALGPDLAHENSPVTIPFSQINLSYRDFDGNKEITFGALGKVNVKPLKNPIPITKSISVRSWCLETSLGQTLYVTKFRRISESTFEKPHSARTSPRSNSKDLDTIRSFEPKELFYNLFCQQLPIVFEGKEIAQKDIECKFDLPANLVSKWLNRAMQEGKITRISKRPVKYLVYRSQPDRPGLNK